MARFSLDVHLHPCTDISCHVINFNNVTDGVDSARFGILTEPPKRKCDTTEGDGNHESEANAVFLFMWTFMPNDNNEPRSGMVLN